MTIVNINEKCYKDNYFIADIIHHVNQYVKRNC